ncbi:MAG: tetratricopeptide repeat protein [Crocinitomicaceae bacterium]|nr:tetratricopeptide repeat protein [Crocinitomicaceae bacterium]
MIKFLKYLPLVLLLLVTVDSYSQKNKKDKTKKSSKKEKGKEDEKANLEFQFYFHDAIREKIIGNYQSAIRLFEKCVELKPDEDAVHYALSELYAQIGSLNNSFEHGEKAVKLDPKNKFYRLNFALISLQVGKYKEAVAEYQTLLKNEPDNLEYLFQYSECLVYMNEIDKVLEVYEKIEEQVGIYKELSLRKHEIYRELKRNDEAIAELEKLIKSSPGNPEYYQYLIDYYNSIGEKEKGFATLEFMIKENPDNGYAQITLSEHYMSNGELEKAMNALFKAFSGKSVDIDTKVKLLITLFDISEDNTEMKLAGFQLLDSLTKYHPDDAKAYSIKGDFMLRDNRSSEARRAFKKASELDDTRFAIWKQLVLLDGELQNYEYMWEDAYKASENFPSQPMFYLFQGMAGLKISKYKEAAEILDFGRGIVVNDKELRTEFDTYLAEAWFRSKEYKRSFELYEKLVQADSENSLLLNNYAYYLSLANQNLDRAKELSLKAIKLKPSMSTYEDTYAYILFRKEQFEEALKWAKKAKENASYESGTLLEHLGDIYFKLNDLDQAIEYWQKALKFNDHTNVLELKIKDKKFYEAK